MFAIKNEHADLSNLLDSWTHDPQNIKGAFVELKDNLFAKNSISLSFKSRPGISFSLRASINNEEKKNRPLFVMIDIIDDDPENRWLSVCFYEDMITDPDDLGDFVPQGLLGEDGYCFDLYDHDESLIDYIKKRIGEAYE